MSLARNAYILTLLLLIGGISCFVAAAMQQAPLALTDYLSLQWLGSTLLLCAATGALLVISTLRKQARVLSAQLHAMAGSGNLDPLQTPSASLRHLVAGLNDVLTYAQKRVADAAVQVKQLELELKVATAERQHAEAIIYSISDAVLVTSPFDELVLANDAAAKALNFILDDGSASRCPVDRLLQDRTLVELIRDMRQSNSKSNRRIVEHKMRTPDGDRTFKVTLSCVADTSGPAGVVAVLHDMTREKEVSEMKNDFVSNVSHELRTPLASIKAYVEMLIDGEAQDERTKSEFYDIIQSEANRLGRLIDNILNISRIESGLVKVNKQPQSVAVVVKEAIEVIAPQAKLKSIALEEDLIPLFYQSRVDHDMLYQAVLNLLSNAVKYTRDGGTMTVRMTVDEARRKVMVRIIDTGVGIAPKDLPFVFDKFYRAEGANRIAKGTGLGLSLVKHIVEGVHQGCIIAESELGKGSCFGFEIDLSE